MAVVDQVRQTPVVMYPLVLRARSISLWLAYSQLLAIIDTVRSMAQVVY